MADLPGKPREDHGFYRLLHASDHSLSGVVRVPGAGSRPQADRAFQRHRASDGRVVAANPEHLGASIGFLSILHTWGQNLLHHPHVHCVVPGGGISPDQTRWIHSRPNFLLPVPVLKIVFRAKVRDGLKRLFRAGKLVFAGELADLSRWNRFLAFVEPVCKKEWVVYAKAPFRGPDHLLQYLARYTHRMAISNHRLLAFDGESVTFRWKDYAHGNKKRKMTISADEFLRRFLLHTLPRGFVRIRFFGFMAGPRRSRMLQLARRLLETCLDCGTPPAIPASASYQCPVCATPMIFIERLTAAMVRRAVAAHQDAINDSS